MQKSIKKDISRIIISTLMLTIMLFIIAFIIINIKDYNLTDVLFVEGIILAILGSLFSTETNLTPSALVGLWGANVLNNNLASTSMERERNNKFKPYQIGLTINSFSLILSGVICIALSFLI